MGDEIRQLLIHFDLFLILLDLLFEALVLLVEQHHFVLEDTHLALNAARTGEDVLHGAIKHIGVDLHLVILAQGRLELLALVLRFRRGHTVSQLLKSECPRLWGAKHRQGFARLLKRSKRIDFFGLQALSLSSFYVEFVRPGPLIIPLKVNSDP